MMGGRGPRRRHQRDAVSEMRFEVEIAQENTGVFRATAVAYPEVTATGRTEKEALGLLMEAMERYMKKRPPTP